VLKTIVVGSALLLVFFQCLSAAVDCGAPLTREQRVVCATPELMNLDQQLWSVYKTALAATSGTERKQFEHDQAAWEVSSGGCGDRVDCITKRYTDRIAVLRGVWLPRTQIAQGQTAEAARRQAQEEMEHGTARAAIPIYVAEPKPVPQPVESAPISTASRVPERYEPTPAVPSTTTPTQTTTSNNAQELKTATGDLQHIQGQEAGPERNRPQEHEAPNPVVSTSQRSATPTRNDDWIWLVIFGVVAAVVLASLFFMPTIVAFSRKHRNRWLILVLNLAFGATLVGWVIALVWAMNKVDAPIKGGIKYDPQPNDPIL